MKDHAKDKTKWNKIRKCEGCKSDRITFDRATEAYYCVCGSVYGKNTDYCTECGSTDMKNGKCQDCGQ